MRTIRLSIAIWMIFPAISGFAHIAVMNDAIPLYILAAMALMFAPGAAFAYITVTSAAWARWTLHAYWSIRNREIGPWSSRTRYALAYFGLFFAQASGAAIFALMSFWLFPEYPSGWP